MVPESDIPLLLISPAEQDHQKLLELLAGSRWLVFEARSISSALALLRQNRIPLVICERDLQPGYWQDVLDHLALLSTPPYLIVTSRQADDALWVETLTAGAYDLLPKPWDPQELSRTLFQAWLRWQNQFAAEPPSTSESKALAVTA